jgi:hypothetical protein
MDRSYLLKNGNVGTLLPPDGLFTMGTAVNSREGGRWDTSTTDRKYKEVGGDYEKQKPGAGPGFLLLLLRAKRASARTAGAYSAAISSASPS